MTVDCRTGCCIGNMWTTFIVSNRPRTNCLHHSSEQIQQDHVNPIECAVSNTRILNANKTVIMDLYVTYLQAHNEPIDMAVSQVTHSQTLTFLRLITMMGAE